MVEIILQKMEMGNGGLGERVTGNGKQGMGNGE